MNSRMLQLHHPKYQGVFLLMNTVKPHSQSSFLFDLLNLLGISLLAGLSSAIALAGIVLLLSSGS